MRTKRYYRECPYCHSNLDPGEVCTCRNEKEQEQNYMKNMLRTEKSGQMNFCFSKEVSGYEKAIM